MFGSSFQGFTQDSTLAVRYTTYVYFVMPFFLKTYHFDAHACTRVCDDCMHACTYNLTARRIQLEPKYYITIYYLSKILGEGRGGKIPSSPPPSPRVKKNTTKCSLVDFIFHAQALDNSHYSSTSHHIMLLSCAVCMFSEHYNH